MHTFTTEIKRNKEYEMEQNYIGWLIDFNL